MTEISKTKIDSPLDHAQKQIKSILSDVEIYKDENRNLIKISPNTIISLVKCLLFPDDNREELNFSCDSAVASGFDKKSKFFTIFYNEIHRLYISDYQIKPNNAKWEINNIIYNSFFECLIDQILKSFNPNHKVKISHLAKEEQKKISKIVTKKDVRNILCGFIDLWEKYQQNNFTKFFDIAGDKRKSLKTPIEELFNFLKENKNALLPYIRELEEYLPEKDSCFDKGYRAIERFVLSVNFIHSFFHKEVCQNKSITAFIQDENKNLRKVTRSNKYLFGVRECNLIFPSKSSFFDINSYHDEYISFAVHNISTEQSLIKQSVLFVDREELLEALFFKFVDSREKIDQIKQIISEGNIDIISNLFQLTKIKKDQILKKVPSSICGTKLNEIIFDACKALYKERGSFSYENVYDYIKNNVYLRPEINCDIIKEMNFSNPRKFIVWESEHINKNKDDPPSMNKNTFQKRLTKYRKILKGNK
jgi:hypothetical protein